MRSGGSSHRYYFTIHMVSGGICWTLRVGSIRWPTNLHLIVLLAQKAAAMVSFVASLEFSGPGAGEIKRHPEIEALLVATDNGTQPMRGVLNWVAERVN